MNNPPYPTDLVQQGGDVFPRGSFVWVKFRLVVGNMNPAPPDADAFRRIDVYRVLDPDGVTLAWATNILDPDDPTDEYDDTHPDYVGRLSIRTLSDGAVVNGSPTLTSASADFDGNDIGKVVTGAGIPAGTTILTVVSPTEVTLSAPATQTANGILVNVGTENVGLFAEGGAGAPSGRFALKLFIPTSAEETALVTSRQYTARFRVKKNGVVTTPKNGDETFDVGPAGVIVFSSALVSVAEVKAGITSALSDEEVIALIEEATLWVQGVLEVCGIDVSTFVADGLPPLVRMAIVLYARGLVFDRDASSGLKVSMWQEGTKRVGVSGMSSRDSDTLRTRASEVLDMLCKRYGNRRRHNFGVVSRTVVPLDSEATRRNGWMPGRGPY